MIDTQGLPCLKGNRLAAPLAFQIDAAMLLQMHDVLSAWHQSLKMTSDQQCSGIMPVQAPRDLLRKGSKGMRSHQAAVSEVQLRSERSQQYPPFYAHSVRHSQDQFIALGSCNERQSNACVPAGRLDLHEGGNLSAIS